MNRNCRNSQEKKSNEKKAKSGAKKTPLFFCTKKSAATNDSGYGCRGTPSYFITAQKKRWAAIKKSATTNDSGYGCRGTLSYFITA